MKSFWFIFSLYILILTVLPCTDKEECNEPAPTSISTSSEHHNHNHNNEHCSPFCICACCGTNANIPAQAAYKAMENPIIHIAISHSLTNDDILSNFFGNIWQPPKIC